MKSNNGMAKSAAALLLPFMLLSLTGCSEAGEKSGDLSVIYGIAALLSVLMLVGCCFVKKKSPWFFLLFASVAIVNVGYYLLAVSEDLDQALMANRVAYLGSVFLPLSMWMIILQVTNIRYPKWIPGLLLGIGAVVFLIAASPGYSHIYYKEVSFQKLDGVTVLQKVYGPLHVLYLFYLVGYFITMVVSVVYAVFKKKMESVAYVIVLALAVFFNIGVWLIEQYIDIKFELLSVSYIICEAFLLGLYLVMREAKKIKPVPSQPSGKTQGEVVPAETVSPEAGQMEMFLTGLPRLTPKERMLYDCYVSGMSTAEIMEQLNIKENTLKFHNKNLYSKLGVSSRKQLLCLAEAKKNK